MFFLYKYKNTLIVVHLFIAIVLSGFPQIDRWVLAQPIAMADQAIAGFGFYPSIPRGTSDIGMKLYADTSVYFPGVAVIAVLIQSVLSKIFVYELMVILAAFVLCGLFFTIHKLILLFIFNDDNIGDRRFFFLALNSIWLTLVCEMFLNYSSVFKPDAVSIFCGMFGLFLLFRAENKIQIILGGISIGLGVLFKQQYIAFFIGFVIVSCCLPGVVKSNWLALFSSVMVASFCLVFTYIEDPNFFWTINVVMDDGFLPFETILIEHGVTAFKCVGILFSFLVLMKLMNVKFVRPRCEKAHIFMAVPIILFAGASFLSSLKLGGNVGNTQIGLYVMFPVMCIFFGPTMMQIFDGIEWPMLFKNIFLFSISMILVSYVGLKGALNLGSYAEAHELRSYFSSLATNHIEGSLVAHRSFCYYGVRELRQPQLYVSLNTANLLESGSDRWIEKVDRATGFFAVAIGNTKENLEYLNSRGGFLIQKQSQRCLVAVSIE